MELDLYWQAVRWLALEHVHIVDTGSEITADGLIVGAFDGFPLRLQTRVVCDPAWETRSVSVHSLTTGEHVELERSPGGGWRDPDGEPCPDLADAIDVDIAATPFTNTLPIRRLNLPPGESAEIAVVYVTVTPSLSVRPTRQRYTRLLADTEDRYLYESLESDFKRELRVDDRGFVVDYPGIWRRPL
jgi:uncharacterized protein